MMAKNSPPLKKKRPAQNLKSTKKAMNSVNKKSRKKSNNPTTGTGSGHNNSEPEGSVIELDVSEEVTVEVTDADVE